MLINQNKDFIFDYNISLLENSFSNFLKYSRCKTFRIFKRYYMTHKKKEGFNEISFKGLHFECLNEFFFMMFHNIIFHSEEEKKKELENFTTIIALKIVLIEINFFNKLKIEILNAVNKNKIWLRNSKDLLTPETFNILNFTFYFLEELCNNDHFSMKEINLKAFHKYDEILDNTFTLAIKGIENYNYDDYIKNLYSKLGLNTSNITENALYNIEKMKDVFFSFFTDVLTSEETDNYKNINLRINAFKNREHFFSFFENFQINEIEYEKDTLNVFSNFFPILMDSFINFAIICTIDSKNLQKAIRHLKKTINTSKNEKEKNNIYKLLLALKNRDLSFKYLPIIFISHHLSLSHNYAYNFASKIDYLTKKDNGTLYVKSTKNKNEEAQEYIEGSVNKKSFLKFYCIIKKIYFPYNRLHDKKIENICKNTILKEI